MMVSDDDGDYALCRQWHRAVDILARNIYVELQQQQQQQLAFQSDNEKKTSKTMAKNSANTTTNVTHNLNRSIAESILPLSNDWYDRVFKHYHEPHRAYHNWRHIQEVVASIQLLLDSDSHRGSYNCQKCINITTRYSHNEDNSDDEKERKYNEEENNNMSILSLATFFHDVIYDPQSSTNEKDSASEFIQFVSELSRTIAIFLGFKCVEDDLRAATTTASNDNIHSSIIAAMLGSNAPTSTTMIQQIEKCILATASHIDSANQARQMKDALIATFLDADMSILGCVNSSRYDEYALSIRKEYEFVERTLYCEKRAEILESFLPLLVNANERIDENGALISNTKADTQVSTESDVPPESKRMQKTHRYIYATDRGRNLWEDQARQNLVREIDLLRRGCIPGEKL